MSLPIAQLLRRVACVARCRTSWVCQVGAAAALGTSSQPRVAPALSPVVQLLPLAFACALGASLAMRSHLVGGGACLALQLALTRHSGCSCVRRPLSFGGAPHLLPSAGGSGGVSNAFGASSVTSVVHCVVHVLVARRCVRGSWLPLGPTRPRPPWSRSPVARAAVGWAYSVHVFDAVVLMCRTHLYVVQFNC